MKNNIIFSNTNINIKPTLFIQSFIILSLFVTNFLFCNFAVSQEQEGAPVDASQTSNNTVSASSVEIYGNKRVDKSAVLAEAKIQKGELNEGRISEIIKAIYNTGYFDQVTAEIDNGILKLTVTEKPLVRKVFVKGNKGVKDDSLAEVLTFGNKKFLDKTRLQQIERAGSVLYQTKGYYDVKIISAVKPLEDNQVDVTFTIEEGSRYKIKKVVFRGLEKNDPDELRDAVETKRYKWWSSWILGTGRLNRDQIENDKVRLRQFFLDRGYIDATLSEPSIEKSDDQLVVAFQVKEGAQYSIGDIKASGNLILDADTRKPSVAETLDGIKSEKDEIFNASKIRDDSFIISEKFGNEGYAFTNVVPNTTVDRANNKINIDFGVEKGKKATVHRINIKGNEKTYDNVIRRDVRVAETELYSAKKIKRSEALLKRLGYFEEVSITAEPTDKDDEVNLNVNVKEAPTGSFTAGAGFSTSDGPLFNARIAENNVFGTGRKFDISADIGQLRSNAIVSFLDPRIADSFVSGGVDAEVTNRVFRDFDRNTGGGGINLGYPLEEVFGETFEDISFGTRYGYLAVDIKLNQSSVDKKSVADFVINSEGTTSASSLTPELKRNTIDNPQNPTKGSRQTLSYEYAGAGGDARFWVGEAKNQWYYPMIETEKGPIVFSLRTRLGYGKSLDDKNPNDPTDISDRLPLFKRYFPGGINSVRGYRNRSLGPLDEGKNEFGGSKEFINNAELIFPLVSSAGLRGVIFYDMGEAFDDDDSIDFGGLKKAYGFGIRWNSPMGPLRLEFGIPSDKEVGGSGLQPQFSFGAPF